MKVFISKKNPAFAVIIALVAVTVLTLMAGAFAYAMKVETRLAANANNDEQFYWMGRGGVDRACWWLALEGNQPFSSKDQYWNHGPGDGPETNSPLAFESLDNFPVGPGSVSLSMTELESKININTADTALLQQVLTQMGVDASEISVVTDSILDWIDPDDATRMAGAESDYYQGLIPPYNAKNGPLDNIDELQLIKGITREMFAGGGPSTNSMGLARHRLGFGSSPGQTPDYPFGLRDVFTPFSNGRVNLLTAEENVLALIPGVDTITAQNIIKFRDAANDPPARDLNRLLIGANPQAMGQIQRYAGVRGDTYEVHATATIGEISHEFTAIVYRAGPNVQVVSFYRTK
jgi:general secretion pathway protein K